MTDSLVISLEPEVIERLRKLAEATGEPVEALARGLLEDTAAEFDGGMGDDAELVRRIALWRQHRLGIRADEVHGWLETRVADPQAPMPTAKRMT